MAAEDRDRLGSLTGVAVFLGGIALLGLTFSLAYGMFTRDPADALGLQPGRPLDINQTGVLAAAIVFRVLLLIIMCVVASVIANRGIRLYMAGRGLPPARGRKAAPEPVEEPARQ
jgi:hypothetical protein